MCIMLPLMKPHKPASLSSLSMHASAVHSSTINNSSTHNQRISAKNEKTKGRAYKPLSNARCFLRSASCFQLEEKHLSIHRPLECAQISMTTHLAHHQKYYSTISMATLDVLDTQMLCVCSCIWPNMSRKSHLKILHTNYLTNSHDRLFPAAITATFIEKLINLN